MRNIFDQYSQQENRLTHALVITLYEDSALLKLFVMWVTNARPPKNLTIIEQQIVGEPEQTEEESERKGLPDAWIHDDENWSLLIESKISSPLNLSQLQRHIATARRCSFTDIFLLAITVEPHKKSLPDHIFHRTWSECYEWLIKQGNRSEWAQRATRYLETMDAKWAADGYLREGTLTMFTGIPFSKDKPYNYREAKLILKQAMAELRSQKLLAKELGADIFFEGRSAITGKQSHTVWDYIPLQSAKEAGAFTSFPHLTLFLNRDHVGIIVSIPNGLKRSLRRKLIDLGEQEFVDLMEIVKDRLVKALSKSSSGIPVASVQQRHYRSQRSIPVVDARLEYDLRTAFPREGKSPIKCQPDWLHTTFQTLANKQSNLHLSVGAFIPYADGSGLKSAGVIRLTTDVWLACKPLIQKIVR